MPIDYGFADPARPELGDALVANLVSFCRYQHAMAGGFTVVPVRTPGAADGSQLAAVADGGTPLGTAWQGADRRWWGEGDLAGAITPSAVVVDGTSHPTATTTGPYAHAIDRERGIVRFAAAIAATSVVQVARSARTVGWCDDSSPWYRQVVAPSLLGPDDRVATPGGTPVPDLDSAALPLVAFEPSLERRGVPVGLGTPCRRQERVVLARILAADKPTVRRLADFFSRLEGQFVPLFDPRVAGALGLLGGGTPWPALLAAAPLPPLLVRRVSGSDVSSFLPLCRGTIRLDVEVAPLPV